MAVFVCNEKRQEFSCLIPFSGFYYSIHDERIDEVVEELFQDVDGNTNYRLHDAFCIDVDHEAIHEKYAERYTKLIAEKLGVSFEYEELISPRQYNFETDRIFAKLSREDFCKLLKQVRGRKLDDVSREMFTSRSGFRSFYSNRVSQWGKIENWDHNQTGAVVAAAWKFKVEEDGIDTTSLVYEEIDRDSIEEWVCDAAGKSAKRALRINDYLRRRKERQSENNLILA